ncbi:MAG: N-acetylmuramoyl-L-alanine amidase [Myxococcota bacterium]
MLLLLLLAAWPVDGAVHPPRLPTAPTRKVRVFVDAGHGAPGNTGAFGCYCQAEQEHTLRVADHLAYVLSATGRFEVRRARTGLPGPGYRQRVAAAEAWKADVIISIHADVRGSASEFPVELDGGVAMCWRNPDAPGFAVLWNDEGPALAGRERLGRAVGARLREAGFLAYDGYDYATLYRQDDVEPSGWIDQRPMKKRVYFLRATKIPTVIIETHHALDVREVARWDELATVDAFAFSIGAAVLDFAQPPAARVGVDAPSAGTGAQSFAK